MHTPVEMVSLKDLDNVIKLLVEYIAGLKATDTFVPQARKARN
jgi:putative aminopeptidase FrvX